MHANRLNVPWHRVFKEGRAQIALRDPLRVGCCSLRCFEEGRRTRLVLPIKCKQGSEVSVTLSYPTKNSNGETVRIPSDGERPKMRQSRRPHAVSEETEELRIPKPHPGAADDNR
ncbi:hypothetical protein NPIL_547921 [Nephila pilipes]|uniref:Uncharacterized protein n=1 Tax=Nephila pilipes TaxID=299642 RepID=A0A8X6U2P8_NEPPI|nr:hypothetical protein NPIL_547921 [Nephila pilipes]